VAGKATRARLDVINTTGVMGTFSSTIQPPQTNPRICSAKRFKKLILSQILKDVVAAPLETLVFTISSPPNGSSFPAAHSLYGSTLVERFLEVLAALPRSSPLLTFFTFVLCTLIYHLHCETRRFQSVDHGNRYPACSISRIDVFV